MKSSPKNDLGLLILRVAGSGLLLSAHGIPKLMKYFGEDPIQFGNPIGIGSGPSHFCREISNYLRIIRIRDPANHIGV